MVVPVCKIYMDLLAECAPTRLLLPAGLAMWTTCDCCEGVWSVWLSCVKVQLSVNLKLVMCEVWHAC